MVRTDWRVLIYIAGDVDLDSLGFLQQNLWQLEQSGPSPSVEVYFQIDRSEAVVQGFGAKRFRLARTSKSEQAWFAANTLDSVLVKDLGELNTGDPAVLRDFVAWGLSDSTADKHALILWGHGSGALDIPAQQKAAWGLELRRRLFDQTVYRHFIAQGGASTRAFGYDDSAGGDAIENSALETAIISGVSAANRTRAAAGLAPIGNFDVLAFDACFMSSLEVAMQVSSVADVLVGSEVGVPGQGLPYDWVLSAVKQAPGLNAYDIAPLLCAEFHRCYSSRWWYVREAAAISAVRTDALPNLARAVDALAGAITGWISQGSRLRKLAVQGAFQAAANHVLRFFNGNYADAAILLRAFVDELSGLDGEFAQFAARLQAPLATVEAALNAVVLHNSVRVRPDTWRLPTQLRTSGLTLLFPSAQLGAQTSALYGGLRFCRAPYGRWRDLLQEVGLTS